MSYVIEQRRADAVKPGDVMLAQHNGLVGPWRVTQIDAQPSTESSRLDAVTLRLHRGSDQMLQLHRIGDLVLLLADAPEPVEYDHPGQVVLRSGRLEVRLLDGP